MQNNSITQEIEMQTPIAPVSERHIGWLAYADRQPIETCATDAMRRGWLQANRDEANAMTSQVYGN